MSSATFHPATFQLLRLQSRGRRRRMWRRFCQPRRLVLSALACALAVLWLSNAATTVWLRERATPETLRALLSLGLVLYAGWHVTKAAFFRPESPFDWTPGEQELLGSLPLRPRDLVAYQLASITVTTLLKAGLFTLLLLPELRCLPLGMAGLMLAMLTLEMVRMAVSIAAWGMSRPTFLAYRAVVTATLIALGLAAGAVIVREDAFGGRINVGEGLLHRMLDILVALDTSIFRYAALPFQPLIELVMAERLSPATAVLAAAATGGVIALAAAVIGLYSLVTRQAARRERLEYATCLAEDSRAAELAPVTPALGHAERAGLSLPRIVHLGGAGGLAWRQLVGARRHWGSLLTAMVAPAVFASAPCFVIADPYIALLATTGTLAFYTFLLLPTALRFDFRRDLDRLATLKAMPIAPAAAAIGQTLAPVAIATLFQTGVLALAIVARSLPLYYLPVAVLVMIPINLLVFALENLIYLLYPYRVNQEGLEIFLRTMLTFTAKGLLFVAALEAMSSWGFAAARLTHAVSQWSGRAINGYAVFTAGMIVGPMVLAAVVLGVLGRTYRRIDPVEDVPR